MPAVWDNGKDFANGVDSEQSISLIKVYIDCKLLDYRANSVYADEAAHNELPHPNLYCLQNQHFYF